MFEVTQFDCCKVQSEEELRTVFTANFPVKKIDIFRIDDNQHLKVFESNVFNGIAFNQFMLNGGILEKVGIQAFDDSSEILSSIAITSHKIEQISFETEKRFSNLGSLHLEYNQMKEFPFERLKDFPKLYSLNLGYNPLGSIPVDSFQGLSIGRLTLSDTVDGELPVGIFANQTRMEWIWASHNKLTHIPAGLFVTGSSRIDDIFLNDNDIVSIEPNAFDLVGGRIIYLGGNSLTTIEESVWRELFEAGVKINLDDDNPLECGCNVAWCVNDPALKQQVSEYTICQDGRAFKDLNPDDFVDC